MTDGEDESTETNRAENKITPYAGRPYTGNDENYENASHPHQSEASPDSTIKTDLKALKERLRITDILMVIATIVIAAATVWNVCVLGKQLNVMQVQLSALLISQRPYLLPRGGEVRFEGDAAYSSFIVENTGTTPAYRVRVWFDSKVDSRNYDVISISKALQFNGIGMQQSTDLGKDIPYRLGKKIDIAPDDLAAIKKLTKAVYLWGRVRYDDGNDNSGCWIEQFWARADPPLEPKESWSFTVIRNDTNPPEVSNSTCD